MRYQTLDLMSQSTKPLAAAFNIANKIIKSKRNPLKNTPLSRFQSAVLETGVQFLQSYPKQAWAYDDIKLNKKTYPINEDVIDEKPFCKLIRFRREGLPKNAPKVLFVAALSGHHATLTKETLIEFLPDHEVFVTDWSDARYVPKEEGRFGLQEYCTYLIEFLELLSNDVHLIGLCQAGVPTLICSAIMSAGNNPSKPKSLSLLASPMDISVNPGMMNKVKDYMNVSMWKLYGIHKVPSRFPGAGRRVYPGILQLSNFMSMNIKTHVQKHKQYAKDIFHENIEAVEKHRNFYNEYFATLDMTEEFCVETLQAIFINNDLAEGNFLYQGQQVDCSKISDIPMLAIEGENDDMVRLGQCTAAIDKCTKLPNKMKQKYVQKGVGHYGVFNGSIFKAEIAPKIKKFIRDSEKQSK